MQKFLINSVNVTLLVIILIGVPAICHAKFGHWQISDAPMAERLLFGGLILGIVINVLGATIFIPGPKAKALCAEWAFIFGGLFFFEYAYLVRGWINFNWLKTLLQWVQQHL
jgi:hypothetical protein